MQMTETMDAMRKRLSMRSWRRGTKEMDLVLGPYADAHLAAMSPAQMAIYDQVLEENDTDLWPMVLGQQPMPPHLSVLLVEIASFAKVRLASS